MWRSLGMLRSVRGLIGVSLLLGVIASALPYVSAAAFGPMVQVIADAGESGNLSGVWDLRGPLVARENGLLRSVAGSVPFAVLLATWAGALLLTQLMYFVNTWVGAKVDRMLLVDIRQRVHDHMQTLSLDFFTGSRSGELMQRVTVEPAGVQRLLTDCLLPPLIDMRGAGRRHRLSGGHLMADDGGRACAHTAGADHPEGRGPRCPGGHAAGDERRPCDGRRAGTDDQRNGRDPDVQRASRCAASGFARFRSARQRVRATSVVWMQAMANGSQVFVALSTVVVLLVGIAFSASFGLTLGGPDRVHRDGPDHVRRRAAGDGGLHHVSVGGSECDVDLRVARHPPFGAGRRGRGRARRGSWQRGVRGCDVRLFSQAKPFSTGCPSRSPKARRSPWSAASGRESRRCSTSCCGS